MRVAILWCAVVLACLSATARADTTHKEINDFVKALSFSDLKAMKKSEVLNVLFAFTTNLKFTRLPATPALTLKRALIPKTAPSCTSSQCTLTPSPLPQPQRNVDSCIGLASNCVVGFETRRRGGRRRHSPRHSSNVSSLLLHSSFASLQFTCCIYCLRDSNLPCAEFLLNKGAKAAGRPAVSSIYQVTASCCSFVAGLSFRAHLLNLQLACSTSSSLAQPAGTQAPARVRHVQSWCFHQFRIATPRSITADAEVDVAVVLLLLQRSR